MMVVKLIAILLLETALFMITGLAVLADNSQSKHDPLKVSANAVIKSIQSEDGDIIDCVDIHKQPAFSHPALKDHKIQMKPSYVPTIDITSRRIKRARRNKNKQSKAEVPISVTEQTWQKSGSCPEGTVPILRMQTKTTLEDSNKSNNNFFHNISTKHDFNQSAATNLIRPNNALSIMITEGYAYLGAKGDIAVYDPKVELDNEYSLSYVSLDNGRHDSFEEIKAGWAVNPGAFGDRQTRFFVYWTADGSHKTGCFNYICPGFVHVSNNIALGAAIHQNISRSNYPPGFMIIYIFKDVNTNNWWLNYGENVNIGYWPASLFRALDHHAESVQWGGDVYSSRVGVHPHTATAMGSGSYASVYGSGVVKRLRVLENSLVLKYPEWASVYADEFDCYNYFLYRDVEDPEFYYGGPGKDLRCP